MPPKGGADYDNEYVKVSHHEQILHRPDTYIGSIEKTTEPLWVFDEETDEMKIQNMTYVPGLYKIFDEVLVNAADNKERDSKQTRIKVDIDQEKGFVKVWNNGEGIPVHMHKKENIYVPDMIFGHLLTSSHYNDEKKKTTGGRNGYGAKLANIFSLKFVIETSHSQTGKKFKKTWKKNMFNTEEATITDIKSSASDFTCVTFWPDFKRFGMDSFDDDAVALFKKRVIDIAGVTGKSLQVYLNGKACKAQKFEEYVDLYPGMGEDKVKSSFACPNDRWQICIRPSNIDYQQISFVNSIWTIRGGQHVKLIVDQAISKISDVVSKKNKKMTVQPQNVRPFLWVFVNAKIENPVFDTQTKVNLITPRSKFGSTCEVPQKMIDGLCKVCLCFQKKKKKKKKNT